MATIDPERIHIDADALLHHESPTSFQDVAAEQLRRAPWLALSALAHAILLFVLYVLLPADRRVEEEARYMIQPETAQHVEPPPEPPPQQKPEVQDPTNEPLLQDPDFLPNESESLLADASEPSPVQSAFEFTGDNPAIGVGGNAGGPYGRRGNGPGGGGSGRQTPASVRKALQWLERHQDEDGKWDCDGFMKHDTAGVACDGPGNPVHDVGVTGLALLAFLGEGSTLRSGPYRDTIRNAVRWLRDQQQENGLFGQAGSSDFVYDHAIAAYAMCEAYGLSRYVSLQKTAQRGLDYLEQHRNPYGVWRYQPRDNDNDTSVTGWCIQALEAGKYFGLAVNQNALKLSQTWLDSVTDASGRAGYTRAGEPSSRHPGDHGVRFPPERGEAMTAVALFSRFFLGQDPKETPVMKLAADRLLEKPPVWDERSGSIDHYYWYYATYALFQAGGTHWNQWQRKLEPAVVRAQRSDGNFDGSWDPVGAWGDDGGRVYSTAILALTMQANYRYAPFVR